MEGKIDLRPPCRIHMVGIGGIGMQGLALLAVHLGFRVSGSDREEREGIKGLLKNREYLILLLAVFLTFSASNGFILFLPYRIYDLGGTDAHYGYATFAMALSEIPALLLYKTISKKLSPRTILCIAFFFVAVKLFSTATFDNIAVVILCQTFQAPAYGLYLCAIANYIDEVVPRSFVFTR